MSSTRNAAEVARARNKADSTLCFWMLVVIAGVLVVGIFALPANPNGDFSPIRRDRNADDDDADNSWSRANGDDDDDDYKHRRHRHAKVAPDAAVAVAVHSLKSAPELNAADSASSAQSHENVLKTNYLGVHPTYVGCNKDEDHIELRAASTVSLQESLANGVFTDSETHARSKYMRHPSAHVEFDEERGEIRFRVDAPYLPVDAAYIVSFEPFANGDGEQWKTRSDILHSPGKCQSSANVSATSKTLYADLWAHAPSALYNVSEMPADVSKRGGAYATGNGWKMVAKSCSRVAFEWIATARELRHCTAADGKQRVVAFDATETIAAVSGSVWLNLLWPKVAGSADDGVEYMQWEFPFSVYVDTFESKLSFIDSNWRAREKHAALQSHQEKVTRAQQAAAFVAATNTPASALRMIVAASAWETMTNLVNLWFDPRKDEDFLSPLKITETEMQSERALRMLVQMTSVCDAKTLLLQNEGKPSDDFKALLITEGMLVSPRYTLKSLSKHTGGPKFLNGQPNSRLIAAYGDFTPLEADFVGVPADSVTCELDEVAATLSCRRNYTIVLAPRSQELYQGSFDAHFCSDVASAASTCDALTPDHTVHIEVAVTDPSADVSEVEQLQISISSHLNNAAAEHLDEVIFEGGDRVCMQTFAVGPPQLTQSVDVRTVAAWLCTDEKYDSALAAPELPKRVKTKEEGTETIQTYLQSNADANSGCSQRKHHVQLFGSDDPKQIELLKRHYNVTLHEPGSYGTWSSAICFNTSTVFIDSEGNSVSRPRQYYQTEVVAVPTEKRRHKHPSATAVPPHAAHKHRTFSSFAYAAHSLQKEPHHERVLRQSKIIRDAVSAKFETLTSPELGRILRTLDEKGKSERFVALSFDVTPHTERERQLHNVHESSALWMILLILACGACIAGPLIWFVILKRRPLSPEAAETPVDDDYGNGDAPQ